MMQNPIAETLKDELVFIVDDDSAILKLIERILYMEGYTNINAIQDPVQVIPEYLKSRPSLLLLDINMPDKDGFTIIEELKQLETASLPPVVFLTGETANELRARAFEIGVLDFIGKPFNKLELLSRVKNLLSLEAAHQELARRNETLEIMVELRTEELQNTQLLMVQKLGRAAEYKDNETGAHILRMSHIASLLGKNLGFPASQIKNLLHASPMHDVGKIAIPDHILMKPARLIDEEWEIMKTHTTLGYELLKGESPLLKLASEIALSHHERWDGSGYPHGLEGDEIPLSCRIVAIADVFDALVSERPYKQPWEINDALDYLNEKSGSQFAPAVVTAFNQLLPQILEIRELYAD